MNERLWFSTTQAGVRVSRHRDTVMKACESGDLHGTQRLKDGKRVSRGRWRIHVDCLDAWAAGEQCAHQIAGAA